MKSENIIVFKSTKKSHRFFKLKSMWFSYLNWNYHDPELAVTGTILHGFEFAFVRLAPIAFLFSVIGIVITDKKDK